jgi:hypothetical protein
VEVQERFKVNALSDASINESHSMPTHTYTRRAVIGKLLHAAAATAIGAPALSTLAQSVYGGPNQRRGGLMFDTQAFQRQYRVPAMSIAISKGGRFV